MQQNNPITPEVISAIESLLPHQENLLSYDKKVQKNGLMESIKEGVNGTWNTTKDIAKEGVKFLKENKNTLIKGAGIALALYGVKKVADWILEITKITIQKEDFLDGLKDCFLQELELVH
jgi:hypothetical protein